MLIFSRLYQIKFLVLFTVLVSTFSQYTNRRSSCNELLTCGQCIQNSACVWCSDPDFSNNDRCFDRHEFSCKLIVDPKNNYTVITDKGQDSNDYNEFVPIRPQLINLELRITEKLRIPFMYSEPSDYPLDIYFLIDLTNNLVNDKITIAKFASSLYDDVRDLSAEISIGFGSVAHYGFINHLSLERGSTVFNQDEIQRNIEKATRNLSAPKFGLDSLLQVIKCSTCIGWRQPARKIIIFVTDTDFNNDFTREQLNDNDGLCHLDGYCGYNFSSMNPPSISQINFKVKQNAINIIFVTTAQQISVYNELSKIVEGSSSAVLSDDSSNVVELVRNEYSKISSSVEMKDNSSSAVEIIYYSKCLSGTNLKKTSKCDGLKVGDLVRFEAEIFVKSCPKDPRDWIEKIQIYPVGINESLVVDLEMLCGCDCENSNHPLYEENSNKCSNHGTYQCGICDCDYGNMGPNCECSVNPYSYDDRMGCRPDNTTTDDCNGRGDCLCDKCECDERNNPNDIIFGTYCECDNFSCERHNDLVCSGSEQGICNCGTCECLSGWTGLACDCRDTISTCLPPNSGPICSGHGECECGECTCEENGRYSGRYCQTNRCNEFKDCVTCQMYDTGPLAMEGECLSNCTLFTPSAAIMVLNEEEEENVCTFYDDDDCRYTFVYSENGFRVTVRAQKNRDCPSKMFVPLVIIGVIGVIAAIILVLFIMKKFYQKRKNALIY